MFTRVLPLVILAMLAPRIAAADGGYFPSADSAVDAMQDIQSPDQHAILVDRGETQGMVVRVRVTGAPDQFAWVLPLPSVPLEEPVLLEEGDALFEYLYYHSMPREKEAHDMFSGPWAWACGDMGGEGMEDGVALLGSAVVGDLLIETLKAQQADALAQWLADNGYRVPEDLDELAKPYVEEGWVFLAMKLTAEAAEAESRRLHVLHLKWSGDKPVYPMRMTRANAAAEGTKVTLFVFSNHRTDVDGMETGYAARFAGRQADERYDYTGYCYDDWDYMDCSLDKESPETLLLDSLDGMWATRLAGDYRAEDMGEDIYPVPAAKDKEHKEVEHYIAAGGLFRRLGGMGGLLAVAALCLGVLFTLGGGPNRRRRTKLLLMLLVVCTALAALPHPASAQPDDPTPPERILLGPTADVPRAGIIRLSYLEFVALSLSFVPIDDLEIGVGEMILYSKTGAVASAMARYRVLDLDLVDFTAGGGYVHSYNSEAEEFSDPWMAYGEGALTFTLPDWRFNLTARYVFQPDDTEEEDSQSRGLDSLFLHLGAEYALNLNIRFFVEPTLYLITERVNMEEDQRSRTGLSFAHPLDMFMLGYGARAVWGRWNLEAALIKLTWNTEPVNFLDAMGVPWLAMSVVWDLY